jgi:hypothetical protein
MWALPGEISTKIGDGVVAIGYRPSKLSKEEFSERIERIYHYGAEHGVDFRSDAA